ncbi:uncharacterized protein MONOS_8887 [Monocercomonoides exilis]|uniref:uncharacterized protein n=1 Tax=Monocercomonoides exilis TaxID=2049356 RepID=UPI00355976FA|nr:hypothetical protein MONOS_8887 [Monocercomonoides exilis]|eukprot:MONOS_8887.1-p1 / transcript=MONOS_8887.1 / gene=MONOS_8887 / organism=Monocercomonoides_exilis_PA203 / gene_product=unspecified product / transcript_product=unspecified product / location=Mono_scaffold00348:60604-61727(-) / protein_length=148 / sequence_SO=supercontig / SO=protein_coding / is_pseudo=false
MTPPPHLNEAILSAQTDQADEVAAGGAEAGNTEDGEVGVGGKEGGSGESTKSRACEVEGINRYVGGAKGSSTRTNEGGVDVGMFAGCRKEGRRCSEGSVERRRGKSVQMRRKSEKEIAEGEDAVVEKSDNSNEIVVAKKTSSRFPEV